MEDTERRDDINEEPAANDSEERITAEEPLANDSEERITAEEPLANDAEERITAEENAAQEPDTSFAAGGEAEVALSPSDTALPANKPVYRWNYSEAREARAEESEKKKKNSAMVYAISVTIAFVLCFGALVIALIFGIDRTVFEGGEADGGNLTETVVKTSERIVYVREYDKESGLLTTQEIYDKCLPSTVSILVSDSTTTGNGSGFIISSDGYIVTANHVVEDMTSIKVVLSDGDICEATLIDGNDYTDIALLKIEKNGLEPIAIGSSDDLLVGDTVVAIGTPASTDYAGSLAKGSVSYKNRALKIYNSAGTAVEKKMRLIQTDALVNPGNSGCPLINEYGEVIGIVTMKLNSTYYEGMCFAIPIDAAMPIVEAMRDGKDYDSLLGAVSYSPAVLGISGENVSISSLDIEGVKVAKITSSEYDIATKLKEGDVITEIDGIAVSTITEVRLILDRKIPNETVVITFYRGENRMSASVVLGS